nr:nucleotide-binding, alpha-beta plait [Tanacetum cinerariifolium]
MYLTGLVVVLYGEDISMLEQDAAIASDLRYSDEGYNNMDVLLGRPGGRMGNDSVMLHYNAANVVDRTFNKPQRDQNTSLSMANSSHKLVNTSSNINTWKLRVVSDINKKFVHETELSGGNYSPRVIKDNDNLVTASNGNGVPTIHAQREIQKTMPSAGVNSTGRPIDDADSRTIFVSNVYFAATKDSLSRHFNKFGDVLKVVIVTEAATGQPKGSAYVEFIRTEAAENALSMDSTSFMSCILKVKELPTMPNIHQFPLHRGTTIPIVHTVLDLGMEKRCFRGILFWVQFVSFNGRA